MGLLSEFCPARFVVLFTSRNPYGNNLYCSFAVTVCFIFAKSLNQTSTGSSKFSMESRCQHLTISLDLQGSEFATSVFCKKRDTRTLHSCALLLGATYKALLCHILGTTYVWFAERGQQGLRSLLYMVWTHQRSQCYFTNTGFVRRIPHPVSFGNLSRMVFAEALDPFKQTSSFVRRSCCVGHIFGIHKLMGTIEFSRL